MYQRPTRELNLCGSMLTPGALEKAIVLSGLTWGMPAAQVCSMQMQALDNSVIVTQEVKEDSTLLKMRPTALFCMGIPVEVDKELPQGTVQLRYQGAVLFEIQLCAIPWGFPMELSGKQ